MKSKTADSIYSHDLAAEIIDCFEEVLSRYDISVPSPEDEEHEPDNMIGLYGSTYTDLLDEVEGILTELLENTGVNYIPDIFSGNG